MTRLNWPAALDSLRDPNTGRLAKPLRTDAMPIPSGVQLRGATLAFSWKAANHATAPGDILERFLGLESDTAILAFARRFGPLRIDPTDAKRYVLKLCDEGLDSLLSDVQQPAQESIQTWRGCQGQFKALIRLAASLREDDRPSRDALAELYSLGVIDLEAQIDASYWDKLPSASQRIGAGLVLLLHVQTLATVTGLKPALTIPNWGERDARLEMVFQDATGSGANSLGLSLFGALLVQLMSAISGSGFATCASCGKPYVPRRRPREGERHYCRACGRSAALRDAKAAYRQRHRDNAGRRRKRSGR